MLLATWTRRGLRVLASTTVSFAAILVVATAFAPRNLACAMGVTQAEQSAKAETPPQAEQREQAAKEDATPSTFRKDPEAALAAMKSIIAAYRSDKGVRVSTKVRIMARQDGEAGAGPVVEAAFFFGPNRQAVVSLRDYQLHIGKGKIVATHASSPLAYLEVDDDGSPYYQLFNAFQALPFPELALALGEDDPGEVCMQLLPQIPNVVPVGVDEEEVDGQSARVVVLESDDSTEQMRLSYDPETMLVERVRGLLRGSDQVPEGAELVWEVDSTTSHPKAAPTDADFTKDVSGRQKVDGLAALINRDARAVAEAEEDEDVEALKVGDPAPELSLPRASAEGDWALALEKPKPVVVDFWATWCGPCVGALPEMMTLAKEFDGRATVMLVNTGEQGSRAEREQRIKDVMTKRKVDLASVLDLDGAAARRWLVRAFPTTFLVGPDGKIAGVWVGSSPRSQKELREKLESLCGKAGAAAIPSTAAQKPAVKPDDPAQR
ncbi:MAG: TlpA disulfide reductase family protein [Limnohabitans sp.]|nr:TlpA disulfide reductase family protein [Limnohabitans sp.]